MKGTKNYKDNFKELIDKENANFERIKEERDEQTEKERDELKHKEIDKEVVEIVKPVKTSINLGKRHGVLEQFSKTDFKSLLKSKATIRHGSKGGEHYRHNDYTISSVCKFDNLTQEQAETLCEILKISIVEKPVIAPGETAPITLEIPISALEIRLCPCGCGIPLKKGSKFKPGHDAKLRSRLIKEYKENKSKLALEELRKWSWGHFLTQSYQGK